MAWHIRRLCLRLQLIEVHMLDLQKLHNYFYPRSNSSIEEYEDLYSAFYRKDKPSVPLLNKSNPHGGVHLIEHATFNTASLLSILYARNTFKQNSDRPNGFKLCLKLIFGSMNNGNYSSLLPGDNNQSRGAIELDFKLSAQLYYYLTECQHREDEKIIVSSGKKLFVFKNKLNNEFIYIIKYFSEAGSFTIGIDAESLFQIKYIILSLYNIKYLHLSFSDIHMMLSSGYSSRHILNDLETHDNELNSTDASDPLGEEDSIRASEEQRKAIYAIGINKWPRKDQKTIQYIQQRISLNAADKMIKNANNMGAFDLFEYVYFMLHSKGNV